jgi:hypothetical protein
MKCLISHHEENLSPFAGCPSKPGPLARKTKNLKVNIKIESYYGNSDRRSDGTWKHGLDRRLIHLDDQVDYDSDVTGYFDASYDDYSSCHVVADSESTRDIWMVDSGCTDHLSPYLDHVVSKEDQKRNCKTANGELMPIYGSGTVIFKHHNGEKDTTLVLTGVYHAPCYRPTLIFPDFSLFFLTF